MNSRFRSLPLSLSDFFGVLLPGLAWLLLLDTARAIFTTAPEPVTPVVAWRQLSQLVDEGNIWYGLSSIVVAGSVVGYVAKARAMFLADRWSFQLLPTESGAHREQLEHLSFPFHARHCKRRYFEEIERLTVELTGCASIDLPGPQPFAIMKRLIRLIAPPLWEELEHQEAEVRLLGSFFLAAASSAILALAEVVREIALRVASPAAWFWLFASILLALVASDGFCYLRRREVEYAYLHTLLAVNARKQGLPAIQNSTRI